MKQTYDVLQTLSEKVSTRKDVSDESLHKTGVGIEFSTGILKAREEASIEGPTTISGVINTTRPYADGTTIFHHAPSDGTEITLHRNASEDSLRVANDGNTSAWFYPNGTAYIELTNSNVQDYMIGSGEVRRSKINADAMGQSQGTQSLREIGETWGGSSLNASASNHSHTSINFNSQYTLEQKEAAANLVASVKTLTLQPQLEPLRSLLLELAHQLMDEHDHDVAEKVRRLKEDPIYAHEYRMKYDAGYFAAWTANNNADYAAKVEFEPRIQEMIAQAIAHYGKVEDSPDVIAEYKRRNPGWARA